MTNREAAALAEVIRIRSRRLGKKIKAQTMNRNAQSTLEYVILLGAVVMFFAAFAGTREGKLQQQFEDTHVQMADKVQEMTGRLGESYKEDAR